MRVKHEGKKSVIYFPGRVIFVHDFFFFTKQGFCIPDLATSIQLSTLQLRIARKLVFLLYHD